MKKKYFNCLALFLLLIFFIGTVYANNIIKPDFKIVGSTIYHADELKALVLQRLKTEEFDRKSFPSAVSNIITKKYFADGFVVALHLDVEDFKKGMFKFHVTEGQLNEVLIDPRLKEIKYVDNYIHHLKSLRPFNFHVAEKYITLLKSVLGGNVDVNMLPIKNSKPGSKKIFNLIVKYYKRYNGFLVLHNHDKPKDITDDPISNAYSLTKGNQFTLGNVMFKVNNLFSEPCELNISGSTSASSLQNNITTKYKHRIHQNGLSFLTDIKYYDYKYLINRKDLSIAAGLEFPLIYDLHHEFNFYTLLSLEKYKSGIPANSAVHNYHFVKTDRVNKESKTKKLILGFRNKHRSFFNNEYDLDLAIHTGSGKMKNNKSSFTKFVGNAAFKYNLNPEWRFSVDLDAQIAPSSIPLNELFVPANTYGGRGMLFMESNVYSAIVAAPQISYFQKIKHPWLYLMKPYLYYEFSAGKSSAKNNEPSSNPRSDSIGTGADFFVVDNLIFNIEYNRRIGPNASSLNKKSNIYAGLIYNFSFN